MRPEPDQEARLTLLADPASVEAVRVVGLSGRHLRCSLEAEVLPGALVEIEGHDWLLLGEVERLERGHPGQILVKVEHALFDTAELARQRQLWAG
ncbi:MAG: hypothetical protein NTZ98_07865 [Acidobacteria bacterium]|jgi:hypothetical protein|nr:hypothetical protein [Acidobacteriota bacterium]